MTKEETLRKYILTKLDDVTVSIESKLFSFSYTIADSILKEEFKGKYRYVGGLQCMFDPGTPEYEELESWLCELAELVLGIAHEEKNDDVDDGPMIKIPEYDNHTEEYTKGGRFTLYRPGFHKTEDNTIYRGRLIELISTLNRAGYVEIPNDNGGDDDYLCVDFLRKEYTWCENGFWPFDVKSLESFEDDPNSSLEEFNRIRR